MVLQAFGSLLFGTLLFGALPGGPEVVVIFLVFGVFAFIPAGLVYYDASKRGNDHPILWATLVCLFGLVGNFIGLLVALALYALIGRK
jgi:hypothetical protein